MSITDEWTVTVCWIETVISEGSWVLISVLKASLCMKLRWSTVQERERSCGGAGDYSHDRIQLEEVHAVRVARSSTLKIPDSLLPIAAFAPVSTTSASICAVRVKGTK